MKASITMGEHVDATPGDHISKIAYQHGFADYRTVWNLGENAELKAKRKNPNVLMPGDKVFLPEWEDKTESGPTDQRHVFKLEATPLMLRIVIRNIDDQPIKNALCRLEVGRSKDRASREIHPLTTNDAGLIEQVIPKDAEHGMLQVFDSEGQVAQQYTLLIGHLNPIDVETGERARLNNMGYFAGYSNADEKQLKWAVEEFQCENAVKPIDGVYDTRTQDKLKQAYGC